VNFVAKLRSMFESQAALTFDDHRLLGAIAVNVKATRNGMGGHKGSEIIARIGRQEAAAASGAGKDNAETQRSRRYAET
jgi:hypothetical protein